jgi:hypothetical protein
MTTKTNSLTFHPLKKGTTDLSLLFLAALFHVLRQLKCHNSFPYPARRRFLHRGVIDSPTRDLEAPTCATRFMQLHQYG